VVVIPVIPEASTWAMMLLGFVGLGLSRLSQDSENRFGGRPGLIVGPQRGGFATAGA
jgi:hypothetical protein